MLAVFSGCVKGPCASATFAKFAAALTFMCHAIHGDAKQILAAYGS